MLLNRQIRHGRQGEQGYIMMVLLLTMALLVIFAAVIVSSITFDIKRDREEEMIHRGVQYSRAIRAYYKKFGRYPMKIEDLENTNQMRFLRKRYKDPITGKDFRLLHFGEAKMSMNTLGGGMIPGASLLAAAGNLNRPGMLTQNSVLGAAAGLAANASAFGQTPQTTNLQNPGGDTSQIGSDTSQPGTPGSGTDANASGSGSGDKLANTTFGGAPIVGVASTSKETTIREFDHKRKYNDWQFVYDPTFDRGFLITTPYQPQLQQFGLQGTQNMSGKSSTGQSSSGFSNTFGNSFGSSSSGMQNNPTSPASGDSGNTNPPSNPPQQQ